VTRLEQLDHEIDKREKELARIQFEGTSEIVEGKLAIEGLQSATNTLFALASAAKEVLSVPMDEHMEQLGKDLFG
jgi:hypothetical protein